MRKKQPRSSVMAAAGQNAQRSPAAAMALEWKRKSIELEIEQFRAKKEMELKNFEDRLSNDGSIVPHQMHLDQRASRVPADASQRGSSKSPPHLTAAPPILPPPARTPTNDITSANLPAQGPTTPRHDKENELSGLFLPNFIPLLGNAVKNYDNASSKRPTSCPAEPLQRNSLTSISTGPSGVTSPDPTALSPRTSPSPSLIAFQFSPTPRPSGHGTEGLKIAESDETQSTESLDSPSPTDDLASDLPLLTRSPRRTPEPPSTPSPEITPQEPARPNLGTRTSSTQSDASTHSLRSSLRKTPAGSSHGRKKSVRISVDNIVLAPGGESPVEFRNGFRLPERVNRKPQDSSRSNSTSGNGSNLNVSNKSTVGRSDSTKTSHVENIADITTSIMKNSGSAGESSRKANSSGKRSNLKRQQRPTSLDSLKGIFHHKSGKPSGKGENASNPVPVFFPPQPLRSPSGTSAVRPQGRDLIEPIPTPPSAGAGNEQDDFFMSDPLFSESGSGGSSRRSSAGADEIHNSGRDHGVRASNDHDFDEEDMFQEHEDSREDLHVVNGHDLLEEDDGEPDLNDEHFGTGPSKGRRISRDDTAADSYSSRKTTSTSPHAGSLPIEIRSSRSWGGRRWP